MSGMSGMSAISGISGMSNIALGAGDDDCKSCSYALNL